MNEHSFVVFLCQIYAARHHADTTFCCIIIMCFTSLYITILYILQMACTNIIQADKPIYMKYRWVMYWCLHTGKTLGTQLRQNRITRISCAPRLSSAASILLHLLKDSSKVHEVSLSSTKKYQYKKIFFSFIKYR